MDLNSVTRLRLWGIGLAFSLPASKQDAQHADIEEALIFAARDIGNGTDLKLLSPVLSWIEIHGERVNIERLRKLKLKLESTYDMDLSWVSAFAFFGLSKGQTRWKLLAKKAVPQRSFGDADAAARLAGLKGVEDWSKKSGFVIPKGSAPVSSKWVLSEEQLAKKCQPYRNRAHLWSIMASRYCHRHRARGKDSC